MAKKDLLKESKMTEADLYKLYLSKAMTLCASREICSTDIHKKLVVWGAADQQAEKIISQLKADRFIDDNRYSEAFVKDKFRYNKWGKLKIASHLKMKNIPDNTILSALALINQETYIETIRSIVLVHKKNIRAKNSYDLKGKLLRYGLSKGFESSILYDIINRMESDWSGEHNAKGTE
jgi:regulatory protein